MAHNAEAAVAFDDADAGTELLSGLSNRADIDGASLILKNGKHLAEYNRVGTHDPDSEKLFEEGHHFTGEKALFASPVVFDGKQIGMLYLRADLSPAQGTLLVLYLKTVAIVLVVSLLLAFLLANRFQRLITAPLLHLAEVVQQIATGGDYSIPAPKRGNDEVGELTDAFNHMLSQIRTRDTALKEGRERLEERVARRTADIVTANGALQGMVQQLEESRNMLQLIIEAIPVRVFWKDRDLRFLGCNTLFAKDAGFEDPRQLIGKNDFAMGWADMAGVYRSGDFEIIKSGTTKLNEVKTQVAPNGETFWVSISKVPLRHQDSEVFGVLGVYEDITDRKKAERELEEINQRLLETSRQAGMAEVATSVLHNVGNVLNSVNVSCSVIGEKVRKSPITSVARTAELLKDNAGDLAKFFTTDPTGLKLPEFLGKLSQRLADEQKAILAEVHSLSENIEHIKDIVVVQQSYADGMGGVREQLPLDRLVEDALRMNPDGMIRHHIQIVRDFHETPPIVLEKHKVLQILVNLIRNAKHALTASPIEGRVMTLKICQEGNHAIVSVTDNGIGIEPENMTRIFAHGFTTKKDGHGFGLHSGALAAREMGGSLSAYSDGPGAGATFTLSLPVDSPADATS
jgi:PAS domain S-box-containing protein